MRINFCDDASDEPADSDLLLYFRENYRLDEGLDRCGCVRFRCACEFVSWMRDAFQMNFECESYCAKISVNLLFTISIILWVREYRRSILKFYIHITYENGEESLPTKLYFHTPEFTITRE